MIRTLSNLIRNPIVQASATFAALFALAFALAPPTLVHDILHGFAISGSLLVIYRFGCHLREALTVRRPDGADMMIVAIIVIAVAIAAVRALRQIGLLDLPESDFASYIFSAATVMMVFAMFLLVVAPPMQGGKLKLTPWSAFILAFGFGTLFSATIIAMRWWW